MNVTDTFETPHPTVFTREQAYRLPSSKPRAALTPYSPVPSTTTQNLKESYPADGGKMGSERHEPTSRIPSSKTLSSDTLAPSPRINQAVPSKGSMAAPRNAAASTNIVTPPRSLSPVATGTQENDAPKKLKLKDKMKSRSTSTKSKTGRLGLKVAHIAASAAEFQSIVSSRGGSMNTGSLTLASPFISRASSPVPDPEIELDGIATVNQPRPKLPPRAETSRLREKFFNPNLPTKPSQRIRLTQSHNGSPRSLKDNPLNENGLLAPKRKGREKYVDYKSPLLSSPRKKGSARRERRPSAPSRLRRSKAPSGLFRKDKSPDKTIVSCPTTPDKSVTALKNKTIMGPPSFIPSRPGNSYATHAQTPLSDARRLPIYESDLDSDLECPSWLRYSMRIGSIDFNRPPSQMSWFGFSHSGEEVDEWFASEDENSTRPFSNPDPDVATFGEDARGVSTPPIKLKRTLSLPMLLPASLEQPSRQKPSRSLFEERGSSGEGEMDMDLSSIAGPTNPNLPKSVLCMTSSEAPSLDQESISKYTSHLISLDDTSDISWITDSIISPPTVHLHRGLKKGVVQPSGKLGNTTNRAMDLSEKEEHMPGKRMAADDGRGKAKYRDLPMLDLRALQGSSGKTASSSAQSRTMLRTQSLPVVIDSTQHKPIPAAATKRTRSGTIVPADYHENASIPAPPHSTYLEEDARASSPGSGHSVGRTRSGTMVRCNLGKLEAIPAKADGSGNVVSAVPLSMTRRTRSGTIQAFIQPISGERRRSRSGSVVGGPALVVPNRDTGCGAEPLLDAEAGHELDMVGIEEEEEMEFAPPDADRISPTERHGCSSLLFAFDDQGDRDEIEHLSPFVDDAYVPQDISSPDPIDFLSFCASRVDERVRMEISAGIQGSWSETPEDDQGAADGASTLLWCVADPPSPDVTLLPRHKAYFGHGNSSKTPVRRRNHTGRRPITRKARFEGFEEINDILLAQKSTIDEGVGFSEDELDLLRKPVELSPLC